MRQGSAAEDRPRPGHCEQEGIHQGRYRARGITREDAGARRLQIQVRLRAKLGQQRDSVRSTHRSRPLIGKLLLHPLAPDSGHYCHREKVGHGHFQQPLAGDTAAGRPDTSAPTLTCKDVKQRWQSLSERQVPPWSPPATTHNRTARCKGCWDVQTRKPLDVRMEGGP